MSGGGSGQPTETRSTTTTEMSPEQRQLYSLVIPEAEKFMKTPLKQFPISAIAGFDPLQEAGQQMTIGAATSLLPQQIRSAHGASDFLLNKAGYIESNPYLQQATQAAIRPTIQTFQQQYMPQIAGSQVTAGGYGDTRHGIAEGLAGQELIRKTGDITSQISAQAYQQAQDNMVKTLGMQKDLAQLGLLPGTVLEAVGSQRRGLTQAQLSEQAQKFMNEQMMPFMQAQEVAALAQGIPGGSATTIGQSHTQQPQTSPLQYLMAGLGLAGSFISDSRLKRDVKFLRVEKGIPIHEFQYVWGGPRFVGVIAQEVEKIRPDAVLTLGRLKMVNYRKLGIALRLAEGA